MLVLLLLACRPSPVEDDSAVGALQVDIGPEVRCSSPGPPGLEELDLGPSWGEQAWQGDSQDPLAAAGLTVVDLTGDGLLEVYLPQLGMDQLLVGGVDQGPSRLPTLLASPSNAATPADVDGDGDLDLFITRQGGGHVLLVNDGTGHFHDGTEAAGLGQQGWPASTGTFGDMDGDGDLDLFVATFRSCDPSLAEIPVNPWTDGPQALWENLGDGTFVDVSDRMPSHPGGTAWFRAAIWVDIDDDGDQDLYALSDRSTSSDCMVNNVLFANEQGRFEDRSEALGLGLRMEGMGMGMGDINGDGLPDFAMSDMQRLWLVLSSPDGWFDATSAMGLSLDPSAEGRWSGWGTELADLDNDADLDLYMGFGGLPDAPAGDMNPWEQPDALYVQQQGSFVEASSAWGARWSSSTRAVVVVDLDQDGWLDLLAREIAGPARALGSQCGSAHWLEVELIMEGPNRNAVGARLTLTADGQEQVRWLSTGGTGLQSASPLRAHFGLGTASIGTLEVLWPDGRSDLIELPADRRVVIDRR